MLELEQFRNIYKGEKILVLGLGPSLKDYSANYYAQYITIGVNDIEKHRIHPDYLIFLDKWNEVKDVARRPIMQKALWESKAEAIFIHKEAVIRLMPPWTQDRIVHINEGLNNLKKFTNKNKYSKDKLYHYLISPFVGLTLALYMGASKIGMIGVDLNDPSHNATKEFNNIDAKLLQLREANPDVEFFNLSQQSRITAFPKVRL
jgi:hypothetical protein